MELNDLQLWLSHVAKQIHQQLKANGMTPPLWVEVYDDAQGGGFVVGFEVDDSGRTSEWNFRSQRAIENVVLRLRISDKQGMSQRAVVRELTWSLEAA